MFATTKIKKSNIEENGNVGIDVPDYKSASTEKVIFNRQLKTSLTCVALSDSMRVNKLEIRILKKGR